MNWLITLVAGFVALIFLMQFLSLRRARQSEGRASPDTTALDGAAREDSRRVYYFYATHCGPCRAMAPVVDRLREAHRNLIKVNVAEASELARGFGIAATPCFVLVENDVIHQVRLGGLSEKQLFNLLHGD